MNNYYRREEEYSVEIVNEDHLALKTFPIVTTKVIGLTSLEDVDQVRYMFSNRRYNQENAKIKLDRTIHFWCCVCRAYIGNRTMPLRIESFNSKQMIAPGDPASLRTESLLCVACGHHTSFNIQDPVISV